MENIGDNVTPFGVIVTPSNGRLWAPLWLISYWCNEFISLIPASDNVRIKVMGRCTTRGLWGGDTWDDAEGDRSFGWDVAVWEWWESGKLLKSTTKTVRTCPTSQSTDQCHVFAVLEQSWKVQRWTIFWCGTPTSEDLLCTAFVHLLLKKSTSLTHIPYPSNEIILRTSQQNSHTYFMNWTIGCL